MRSLTLELGEENIITHWLHLILYSAETVHMQPLYHRRRKDFLIGGGTLETTHRVVSNLYNENSLPPVPPSTNAISATGLLHHLAYTVCKRFGNKLSQFVLWCTVVTDSSLQAWVTNIITFIQKPLL